MKKTLLLSLFLVFSSLFSFALDLIENHLTDGTWALFCNLERLKNYHNIDGVALQCFELNDDIGYLLFLGITDNVQISAGRKLLIKFEDGSVKELTSYSSKHPHIVTYMKIPDSEMKQLVSKRITKIRVEHDTGYIDQDITDNEFSNILKQMYGEINAVLTAPKKDIYSDF